MFDGASSFNGDISKVGSYHSLYHFLYHMAHPNLSFSVHYVSGILLQL